MYRRTGIKKPYLVILLFLAMDVRGRGERQIVDNMEHKNASHVNLRKKRCQHPEGCSRPSVFGTSIPLFCGEHKGRGDIALRSHAAPSPLGCLTPASFGNVEDGIVMYCLRHKGENHTYLRSVRCKYPEGCTRWATFGNQNASGAPLFCLEHRDVGQVRVTGRNESARSQRELCEFCLRKISRRNMAKHLKGNFCKVKGLVAMQMARNRFGRDVTEALKGRSVGRHPSLQSAPAPPAEIFINSGEENRTVALLGNFTSCCLKCQQNKKGMRYCRFVKKHLEPGGNVVSLEKRKTSQYLGVGWNEQKRKWRVRMTTDGKTLHVGFYDNELEAAQAYDHFAMSRNVSTKLNFQDSKRVN
ncbi:hypothetical protein GUITHDRAFT_111551 [Guillardia theta CCMP2712]|uniref:Uncharacterized protein n=1 Tax=Guillardia theta (strain CCMP2712) TaxID=905079 RepID=L1J365_GUITC|nr:hypothetical protein GUITHDRAFT_111551 [Guillardia theta CCMP2712]EKX42579.1 hypothetical protein GUITHDRAFT_111551 [Guillardia theta CCMP2712]|eukprot:XP_005829559.1 hypothetical protein GUITHDRAFT_111551 [Guillardia theta CCMP2712]